MGEQDIREASSNQERRSFVKALLDDVRALERMVEGGMIESGIRRVGAEQEIVLTNPSGHPAFKAEEILKRLDHPQFTNELGRFNLEANLLPQEFSGKCLSVMEGELHELLARAHAAAAEEDVNLVLCGILPTLQKSDLTLDAMTPNPRYYELNRTMVELRGGEFRTHILGLEELQILHDNVMLEACNTSFQVHFQVGADEFADLYNLAQAVTAPVLAAGVNSPVLLQRRLWHETRIALFQQSLDTRSATVTERGAPTRVHFGDEWVEDSVLELFRADIARFRSLITLDIEECSLETLDAGGIPELAALKLHNGTVYRWNRPCYGAVDGIAHLRIENRVIPSGPTVKDEVANAAFFFGLMSALGDEYGDITRVMSFDDAKSNFMAAARYGLDANFRWLHGNSFTAQELILQHLLPLAREGLVAHNVDSDDADEYLGILEKRVANRRTGSQWVLDSLAQMNSRASDTDRSQALVASMIENQKSGRPVHEWDNASLERWTLDANGSRTVGQIMTKNLFTVHPEDVIDLAASLMDWEHIRHVPVEDHEGHLIGLISHRNMLRVLAKREKGADPLAVREVMTDAPLTIAPDLSCIEAIELMRKHKVGCLPVIKNEKLVGIVTEKDFIGLAAGLLEDWLRGAG